MCTRGAIPATEAPHGASRARLARRLWAVVAIGSASLVAGCYELRPTMQLEPKPDVEFQFTLTDAARVAVADKLGPEVREVTGRLVRLNGDDVTLAVREVKYFSGEPHTMMGEEVHFSRQQLSSVNEKTLSMTKSVLLAGAVAVAVGVLVGSKSLLGAGGSSPDPTCNANTPGGCGNTSLRPAHP